MKELTALTGALGSPVLAVRCALFQVQIDAMGGEPLTSVADRIERDIAPRARAAGSLETEGWCLSVVAMMRSFSGDDSAMRPAIERLYELRYWPMLWMTADLALAALMRRGDQESAARLLGFLDRDARPDTDPLSSRPGVRETLRAVPETTEWLAQGATWEAHEVVEFLLARC